MFTVIFAVGRTVGWVAHWNEMIGGSYRIGRPRQLIPAMKRAISSLLRTGMQAGNTRVVISGRVFLPPESVSNHELVESFNAWVDHYNASMPMLSRQAS